MDIFNVNTIAITLLGYPISYIELFGTLFNLWSVWLIARNRIATWPIGIVGVLLFFILFYQIHLYSDTVEQIYYLIASVYGWWQWSRMDRQANLPKLEIRRSPGKVMACTLIVTGLLSILAGKFMENIHLIWPALFPEPASLPFFDALTTIMSFTAMFLMAQRRLESWYYWIAVDIIGIVLYAVKDVRFVALLYVIYLGLAIYGLVNWLKEARLANIRRKNGLGGV